VWGGGVPGKGQVRDSFRVSVSGLGQLRSATGWVGPAAVVGRGNRRVHPEGRTIGSSSVVLAATCPR
jgi:hypothetical protein